MTKKRPPIQLSELRQNMLIRLSDNQKRVLVRVSQAPTGLLGATEAGRDEKLATARDMLVKLGLLDYDGDVATVSDDGMKAMQDENLVDESGDLTDEGQKWLDDDEKPAGGLMKDINAAAGPADQGGATEPALGV